MRSLGTKEMAAENLENKNGTWKRENINPSLQEVHKSIPIQKTGSFFRRLLGFVGPGYLVAVGYMDPGNWATSIAGGSAYGYTLLSVILISNLMAILLQALSAKLGIVSGRDLATHAGIILVNQSPICCGFYVN